MRRVHRPGRHREDASGPGVRARMLPQLPQNVLPKGQRAARQAQEGGGFRQHVARRVDARPADVPDSR